MARNTVGTILALMKALGMFFGSSWDAWRVVLKAIFARPMTTAEIVVYQHLTARLEIPSRPFREVWLLVGRRGGKSFITALIAVYQCTCRTFTLAPGEVGVFMVIAADRKQARVIKGYVGAMLRALGALAEMVESETAEQIDLKNGLRIEIVTSSYRTLRGRTCIGAACDEVAFWQSDDSANPDTEILAALRPAMATQPDAILVCITSPYARRGEVWKTYQRHYGKDEADVLVVNADTRTMNPDVPQSIVDRAFEDDPASAAAEYGSDGKVSFRSDVEGFVSLDVVEACRVTGRYELPPRAGVRYCAFTDPSGGSSDSFTLAIGHGNHGRIIVDCIREARAPFDPDAVTREFAEVLRSYGIHRMVGDKYAGEWPRQRASAHGIQYVVSDYTKSQLYQALLPRLNAGTIELLDHDRACQQLVGLERRTARGGRESIDHAPGGHDDVVNAIAGVAHELRDGRQTIATVAEDSSWQDRYWGRRRRDVASAIEDAASFAAAVRQSGILESRR